MRVYVVNYSFYDDYAFGYRAYLLKEEAQKEADALNIEFNTKNYDIYELEVMEKYEGLLERPNNWDTI